MEFEAAFLCNIPGDHGLTIDISTVQCRGGS